MTDNDRTMKETMTQNNREITNYERMSEYL